MGFIRHKTEGFTPTPIEMWLRRVFTLQKMTPKKSTHTTTTFTEKSPTKNTSLELVAGFTIIEILLVVVFLGIFAGFMMPIGRGAFEQNGVLIAAATYVDVLHRAQELSRSGWYDDAWGVRITATTSTLFRGDTYTSRVTGFEEQVEHPVALRVSGITEVVFEQLTGLSATTGTTTLMALETPDMEEVVITIYGAYRQ